MDILEQLGTAPATFTEFLTKYLEQFSVLDNENTAQDKLWAAQQRDSVSLYIAYFDKIIMGLPNASEDKLMHAYIYGLKPYIKDNTKAHVQ